MLQRIQTVFLLLAVVAISLTFILPLRTILFDGVPKGYYTNYGITFLETTGAAFKTISGFVYIAAAAVLLVLLFTISQFKRRKFQLLLCKLLFVLLIIQIALNIFLPGLDVQKIKLAKEITLGNYEAGFFMPTIAIVCVFIAQWRIKKDEELVKSADRLR